MAERYEGERGRGPLDRPSRSSGPRSRRSSTAGRGTRGLYGSQIGSNMARASVAEIVGSFILVFTGTAAATAALLNRATAGGPYDSLAVVLAFGLALAAVVAALGHVAGAHVNPAVTLGLAVTNNFPWRYVPAYIGAQLIGAILGAIGTWIAFGDRAREVASLAATYPVGDVGDFRAMIVEALVTFILVFVVVSVATDDRAPAAAAPLAVGFALAAGIFIAGPVTGGALNPVRALGPMIVSGNFTSAWVYIVGPILGGVLAAVLYDRFVRQADAPGTDDPE
ncbi:MIP/aquaporin family protein [Rubrobacter marinus]|nr:aquaporin [Rubrobacter marinus]